MAFCGQCGQQVEDGAKFCPACGAAMEVAATAQEAAPATEIPVTPEAAPAAEAPVTPVAPAPVNTQQTQGQGPKVEQKANDFIGKMTDTPDSTAEFDPKDIETNKILALFSYINILFLIPLLAAPQSKFARFHANQGLILFILELIIVIVGPVATFILGLIGSIGSIVGVIAGILSFLVGLVIWVAGIACFILAVIGIINAVNGKAKELPVVGKVRILK